MKQSILILFLVSGCKHAPTIPDALDAANKTLAGASIAVEGSKLIVDEATTLTIQLCEPKPVGDARRKCMGALGKPVAPAYEKAGAAYDAAVEAIDAFKAAYEELRPAIEAAREVTGK